MRTGGATEGLRAARLMMVLSSISPLFIVWAIKGNDLIPDLYFVAGCLLLVLLPNVFLWLRIRTAQQLHETREITVGSSEDHRDHLLVYLFTMLLPFYAPAIESWREFGATLATLGFIVFLFWHLNLHYMNLGFAVLHYRVFTVFPPADNNPITGLAPIVIVSRRIVLTPGERLVAYRLSDSVYLEGEK